MQGITRLPRLGHVHQAAKLLRSQCTVHKPFSIPGGFQRAHGGFAHHAEKERQAEGPERVLRLVIPIGVSGIERSTVLSEHHPGIVERHEQAGERVIMNEHCKVATISNVTAHRIHRVRPKWAFSILNRQPRALLNHVIDSRNIHAHLSVHGVGAVVEWTEQ